MSIFKEFSDSLDIYIENFDKMSFTLFITVICIEIKKSTLGVKKNVSGNSYDLEDLILAGEFTDTFNSYKGAICDELGDRFDNDCHFTGYTLHFH